MKPLCFILMPFGKKQFGDLSINFDVIYNSMIKPAILGAGMEPIRADEEATGGIIHKAMLERLILCDYAIADLTTANANVFYELGVRHAIKPYTTILVFADSTRLPFDVSFLRAVPYSLDGKTNIIETEKMVKMLTDKLKAAKKNKSNDSPLFQLLDNYPNVAHEKTDIFREVVEYSKTLKKQLADIRNSNSKEKLASLKRFEENLKDLETIEAGVIIDLFLSYRGIKAHQEMVDLVQKMPAPIKSTVFIREQLGFALNRLSKRREAEEVLLTLIKERGTSSETNGLLGRIYKDQWEEAEKAGNHLASQGFLKKGIETYRKGFEADWRDAYPGINACTLLFIENPDNVELKRILPVVRYSVTKKIEKEGGDYWDRATLFELDILEKNGLSAKENLEYAAALLREGWEAETTLRNLNLIRVAREKEGDDVSLLTHFEKELEKLRDQFQ